MQNKANIESIEMMEDNSNVFLRLLYRYLLNHWKWFVLCIVIALPFAYLYLYYSIPEFQVSSTVLIKDPDNKWKDQSKIQELDLFEETKNVDNEIGIIKSINLNRKVVFASGL
jgi:tyrosine-protein kinase Etk/Wzc